MTSLNVTKKEEHERVRENEGKGKPIRQYLMALISNMGLFCFGLMSGWTSPIQPKLEDPEQTPLDSPISTSDMSWVGSLLFIVGIFAPFVATVTVDRFGRKLTMVICCIPLVGGWVMIALANRVELLFVARVLQSSGICVIFIVNVIYISEIATDDARGAISSMVHLSIVLGILVMYTIGPFMSYHAVAYTCLGIAALYSVMLWFIPESPSYYVSKGDNESAKKSLMIIRGKTEEEIESELQKIKISLAAQMSESKVKLSDLWLTKAHIMSFMITFILLTIQQLCGHSVVQFYMISIFAAAGSSIEPEIASIIVAAIQFFASLFVPFVVERLGRKMLLIISLSGVAVCLAVLGTYFKFLNINESSVESLGWIPLLTLVTFIISYCLGIGPLVWTIAGEVFPVKIKTLGISIIISCNFLIAFLVLLAFNPLLEAVGAHTVFWMCCGAASFGLIFVCIVLPETKQKTFQQIQDILNR